MFDKLRKKLSGVANEGEEEEIVFKNFEEDEAPLSEEVIKNPDDDDDDDMAGSFIEGNNIEIKVLRPEKVAEVSTIADYLLDGCTVVLDLEAIEAKSITRMLDFLRGVTYTIDGEIKHISKSNYIITSRGIDISEKK